MVKKYLLGVAFFVIAIIVFGPFLVPVPPLEGTVPGMQLADSDSKFLEVNGLQIHFKENGDGEPALILLHGFGASEFSWREVIAPLSEFSRVIAYDRPAFGLTERPLEWNGENPYSAELQAELVFSLMDELEVNQAILMGNSAGGTIAMHAFLNHPERIKSLILVDPAVYEGGGTPPLLQLIFNTPQMDHIGPLIARKIQDWGRSFAESAWHDPGKITDEIWEGYTKPLHVDNWDIGLWELTKSSKYSKISEQLENFQVPILVITGDDDRIVPTDDSIRLARELPNAELLVIPNCGHIPQEECPEEFLEAVQAYLEKLELN